MAKIVVADALHRAADTALQLLGAKGYSKRHASGMDLSLRSPGQAGGRRQSEVHRMVLANFMRREGSGFFGWDAHG